MNKDLTQLKNILKKYDIHFISEKEFKKWYRKLSDSEYENILKLDIDRNEIEFDTTLLINKNLLSCKDYPTRVFAMSKIKCPKEYNYLLNVLVSKDFLNSKNYYLDMVLLSKAKHLKYCLWLLIEKNYQNNKHHIEDMSMVSKAENDINAQALSEVAMNQDSLQGKYHRKDMEIISTCSKEYLQPTYLYPACSANNLAVNKISLSDPFHLENMQILSSQKIGREYLFLLMTDESIINSKNYRRKISRLQKAKSMTKARAIYYYIANPQRTCAFDYFDKMMDLEVKIDYRTFDRSKCIKGELNSRYNFYLKLLNEIDDNYVTYISYLLSNKNLFESGYLDDDIKFILKIINKKIFIDLFYVMQNENSLNSNYHKNDITIISRIENDITRKMLVKIATNKDSLNSIYHQYDMLFIASLNLDDLDENILNELEYYVLDKRGLTSSEHINSLEKTYRKINEKNSEDEIIKKIIKI